jgi:hypothetical protein
MSRVVVAPEPPALPATMPAIMVPWPRQSSNVPAFVDV